MKKVKWVKCISIVGLLLSFSVKVMAEELSDEETNQVVFEEVISEKQPIPIEETEVVFSETVETPTVDLLEEIPKKSDKPEKKIEQVEQKEETPEELPEVVSEVVSVNKKTKPSDTITEATETVKEEVPVLDELANQKKDLESVINNWIMEGIISNEVASSFMEQLKELSNQGEIDLLFTKFYDLSVVPQAREKEEIVKSYEDEIASWVSAGYITPEEEREFLYLLNEYASLEEMGEAMIIFREIIQEVTPEEVIEENDNEKEKEDVTEEYIKPNVIVPEVVKPNFFLPKNPKLEKTQLINMETERAEGPFKFLPQTGAEKELVSVALGLFCLILFGNVYIFRRQQLNK